MQLKEVQMKVKLFISVYENTIEKNLKSSLGHFTCTFATVLNFSLSALVYCQVVQGVRNITAQIWMLLFLFRAHYLFNVQCIRIMYSDLFTYLVFSQK